jgi:hypothetical protein
MYSFMITKYAVPAATELYGQRALWKDVKNAENKPIIYPKTNTLSKEQLRLQRQKVENEKPPRIFKCVSMSQN